MIVYTTTFTEGDSELLFFEAENCLQKNEDPYALWL
jgi:hypothetical protein